MPSRPDRFVSTIARADADAFFQRQDEDLAVADFSGLSALGGFLNRVDRRADERVVHGDFQFYFRQQSHFEFRATIRFGEPALSAAAENVGGGHQHDFAFGERGLHGFQPLPPD